MPSRAVCSMRAHARYSSSLGVATNVSTKFLQGDVQLGNVDTRLTNEAESPTLRVLGNQRVVSRYSCAARSRCAGVFVLPTFGADVLIDATRALGHQVDRRGSAF